MLNRFLKIRIFCIAHAKIIIKSKSPWLFYSFERGCFSKTSLNEIAQIKNCGIYVRKARCEQYLFFESTCFGLFRNW